MGLIDTIRKAASRIAPKMIPPAAQPMPVVETPKLPALATVGAWGTTIAERTPMNVELGVSGLRHWYGRVEAEEWVPELMGERGKRTYEEMARNDATIATALFLIEQMVKQTPWSIKPVDDSPEQTERASFVESCMSDMYVPWDEFISEALTMLTYGFALFEPVFKLRRGSNPGMEKDENGDERALPPSNHQDGLIGWHKLAPRAQEYTFRWLLDDKGEVLGIIQWAPPLWQQVAIPYEKLLHFKTAGRRHNPEGLSMLRGAFRSWQMLRAIEEIEGIGIERDMCGVPLAEIDAELYTLAQGDGTDAKTMRAKAFVRSVQQLVTRVKTDQQSGIVWPRGFDDKGNELYKFSLISSPGARTVDTSAAINRLKQQIAGTFLADVVLMGHEQVGSFSLADAKTSLLGFGVGGILDNICLTFNRKAIPQLCEANGWEGPFPTLEHGDIETPDLAAVGAFVQALANAGFTIQTPEIERYLLGIANLPTTQEG